MIEKVEVCIKVKLAESALANQSVRQLALQVHYEFQHLVIGLARKHNTTGVQLIDSDGSRPKVYTMIVSHADYWKAHNHTM